MTLTHFICLFAQPALLIRPEPATCPVLISASGISIRLPGGNAGPLLRVGAAPAALIVGRAS